VSLDAGEICRRLARSHGSSSKEKFVSRPSRMAGIVHPVLIFTTSVTRRKRCGQQLANLSGHARQVLLSKTCRGDVPAAGKIERNQTVARLFAVLFGLGHAGTVATQ
jgi:hypothetical protein